MNTIIEEAKKELFKMIDNFGSDPYGLRSHVPEVEKWAKRLLKKDSKVDSEVLLLAVWMHDLGHYPLPTEIDHAVRGEQRAREFLEKFEYPEDKTKKVLHCIRAHRCHDVKPDSIEAKMIACADSASHMTDTMYFDIAKDDKEDGCEFRVYEKIKRDFRDLEAFPEVQEELREILAVWKKLIQIYEKIDLK